MSMLPFEVVLGGGSTILLGVVGYFLRKTDAKVDSTASAVELMGEKLEQRIDSLERKIAEDARHSRHEFLTIFQEACHERQDACSKLRDAKLLAVEHRAEAMCAKMRGIVDDRDRRWDKQETFNEKVREHIYKTKDGGKSWELGESG